MSKTLPFGSGSVIYFQGDEADKIFILQAGQVKLVYQNEGTDEETYEVIQPGEFFGVKSTLGRHPREENAIAVQNSTVVAFTSTEFESLAAKNTHVIMQMLRTFSNQLRQLNQQLSNLVEKQARQTPPDPESGLFNVGAHFLKNKAYPKAKYVFSRYLSYYPRGKNAEQARKNLEIAELNTGTTLSKFPPVSPSAPPLPIVEPFVEPAAAPSKPQGIAASSGPKAASPEPEGAAQKAFNVTETYNNAIDCIRREKYHQAYVGLNKILRAADTEPQYTFKSSYELGHCLYLLAKYSDCIKYYTLVLTKYPKHPNLANILFFMGNSWKKLGKKEQALRYYKKVSSMIGNKGVQAERIRKVMEV
ncbi:MAG: cyclic nucleotide-binding domain-containing protein [Spirochaetaceae bacterium]|jgi:CRP-like cAMP-binding protein|nr:cyclic nucleotide-binding domain-containing protein [Spirochaetaceae bacterium]